MKCGSPHHLACFTEHGKCSIMGCESTAHRRMTALATARVAFSVGRDMLTDALETARERLGGKSTVGLFTLSVLVTGLGVTPLLYYEHASPRVDFEVVLGGLFLILWAWIAALLYRGAKIEDDLTLRPLEQMPGDYYRRIWGTDPTSAGCTNLGGCDGGGCGGGSSDLEGVIFFIVAIILLAVLVFVLFPLIAWLAVEVVFPVIVIGTYGTLYTALAYAVNVGEPAKGKIFVCLGRGMAYAALYTAIVGVVLGMGVKAYRAYAPMVHHF